MLEHDGSAGRVAKLVDDLLEIIQIHTQNRARSVRRMRHHAL